MINGSLLLAKSGWTLRHKLRPQPREELTAHTSREEDRGAESPGPSSCSPTPGRTVGVREVTIQCEMPGGVQTWLYLPSSASVDTVPAGHAHYYGCRASIEWLGARVLPSQAAEHSRVTAPTLEGAGRETDLRVRASRSRATPSV